MWPFRAHNPQLLPAPANAVTLEDVQQAQRKANRAERRRRERDAKRFAATVQRVCWKCTYGAVAGMTGSNLVKSMTPDGEEAYSHANPAVCAGIVSTLTMQSRETISDAGKDFLRVARIRSMGYVRLWIHSLATGFKSFWREDPVNNVGGRASSDNTRGGIHA